MIPDQFRHPGNYFLLFDGPPDVVAMSRHFRDLGRAAHDALADAGVIGFIFLSFDQLRSVLRGVTKLPCLHVSNGVIAMDDRMVAVVLYAP